MGKRLATIFLITLGVALAGVVVFSLVLFLAPGLSVFGIKYIAQGTHRVSDSFVLSQEVGTSNFVSVRIESEQVPVSVVFSQGFSWQVKYYDNYNGLTNSKFDDPSINFELDSDGTAVIKVQSFNKFIYESGSSSRRLTLEIPADTIGGSLAGKANLTIISKSSSINFADEKANDLHTPKFKNIRIETSGKITSSTEIVAENYYLKTSNSIKITEDRVKNINATNYTLNSSGGKIVVDREVSGDIHATTKNSRIQIVKCKNFTANSGYGDIYSARKNSGVEITGLANIKTTAGVVEIDTISGSSGKSVIETKTGNVKLTNVQDLDLKTTRGFIRINSARNVFVETSSGEINVETATESVTAKSKRGKINLGGENNKLYNPNVESTFGKVSVISASGTVKIDTIKADVEFVNNDSSNIKISAGGNLTATKLIGAVNISVEKNATIDFTNFTQKSTIVGLNKKSFITVKLLNNDGSTFSYDLNGNEATLFEYNVEDPENHYRIGQSTNLTSSADKVGKPLLDVKTEGKLEVYYKKTG